MSLFCTTLDTSNPEEIVAFEQAQYTAFEQTQIRTLDIIWECDHRHRRLKSRLPYDRQEVFVAWFERRIVAGFAVNRDLTGELQLEVTGFTVDKSEPDICEGIGLFCLQFYAGDAVIIAELCDHALGRLREQGIRKMYGTCSVGRLRTYKMMGFELLDKTDFHGEQKCLILQDVTTAVVPHVLRS